MEQTIKQWYETIEDDKLRHAALGNMNPENENEVMPSLESAILQGFGWSMSNEGFAFWDRIYDFAKAIPQPKYSYAENLLKTLKS